MNRDGMTMLAMNDWNHVRPDRQPASYRAEPAIDSGPGLWDRFKCAFLCWWSRSCYDSEWQRDRDGWRCVCWTAGRETMVPYFRKY